MVTAAVEILSCKVEEVCGLKFMVKVQQVQECGTRTRFVEIHYSGNRIRKSGVSVNNISSTEMNVSIQHES